MPQSILDELDARGLIHDITHRDELGALLAAGDVPNYCGHDPTATSLHVGHLVPISVQARLQRAGHSPVVLIGGATGMIGDPSGKSAERNLLDRDTLAANVAGIRTQFGRFLDFSPGAHAATLVNNYDWFEGIGFIAFLRDVGKHLTVNYMLAKDSVRSRLEDRDVGISYTEFSYMLLQAYDFVHLSRAHGCRLQIGGSDQWGNITAGTELQRKIGGPSLYAMTMPLLLDASGQKMGKTSTGQRVWLDPNLTSPYAFYQYWLNVSDDDAPRFLRIFSWRPVAEIDEVVRAHTADPGKRLAQRTLAEDLGTWVHGPDAIRRAIAASAVMFGGALTDLTDADLHALTADVATLDLPLARLTSGLPLLDLLVEATLCSSKGDARRKIAQGGIYLNQTRVESPDLTLTPSHRGTDSFLLLRSGKKDYRLIRLS
jgi:tyrosyl-tRNA synthetase